MCQGNSASPHCFLTLILIKTLVLSSILWLVGRDRSVSYFMMSWGKKCQMSEISFWFQLDITSALFLTCTITPFITQSPRHVSLFKYQHFLLQLHFYPQSCKYSHHCMHENQILWLQITYGSIKQERCILIVITASRPWCIVQPYFQIWVKQQYKFDNLCCVNLIEPVSWSSTVSCGDGFYISEFKNVPYLLDFICVLRCCPSTWFQRKQLSIFSNK